mgnify:CR=1 FL=1
MIKHGSNNFNTTLVKVHPIVQAGLNILVAYFNTTLVKVHLLHVLLFLFNCNNFNTTLVKVHPITKGPEIITQFDFNTTLVKVHLDQSVNTHLSEKFQYNPC